MGTFLTRERFGTPQLFAGCLLLIFVAQCCWLIAHQHLGIVVPEDHVDPPRKPQQLIDNEWRTEITRTQQRIHPLDMVDRRAQLGKVVMDIGQNRDQHGKVY